MTKVERGGFGFAVPRRADKLHVHVSDLEGRFYEEILKSGCYWPLARNPWRGHLDPYNDEIVRLLRDSMGIMSFLVAVERSQWATERDFSEVFRKPSPFAKLLKASDKSSE